MDATEETITSSWRRTQRIHGGIHADICAETNDTFMQNRRMTTFSPKPLFTITAFLSLGLGLVLTYQGCGDFTPSASNPGSLDGPPQEGNLQLKIEDVIGSRKMTLPNLQEKLSVNVPYTLTVPPFEGRTPTGPSVWSLTSVPADACRLDTSDAENKRVVTCTQPQAVFNIRAEYAYSDGVSDKEYIVIGFAVANASDLATRGTTLYATHCAACHSPLAISAKKDRTADEIGNSFLIAQMQGITSLQALTPSDIRALAMALDSIQPPQPTPTPSPTPSPTPGGPTPTPSPSPTPSPTPGGKPADYDAGVTLYGQRCLSCHNPLASSEKRSRTFAQIKAALNNPGIPLMQGITLTDAQIQSLVSALNYVPPADPPEEEAYSAPLIGTRSVAASRLQSIFLPAANPTAADERIRTRIRDLVENRIAAFGGPCNPYEGACSESAAQSLAVTMMPNADALRLGYWQRVCDEVLMEDSAVTNALVKAGIGVNDAPTEARVREIHSLFRPGRDLSTSSTTNLINVHARAKSGGLANLDAWRFLIVPMCQSPSVQML